MSNKVELLELRAKIQDLEDATSFIEEGFLVIDRDGKIKLGNDSFRKIICREDVEGKPYWNVFEDESINELLKRAIAHRQNITEEIIFNNKIYTCHINFVPKREKTVVVFYDITEIKKLEKIKRDFVSNVSHELRTPLTAIKGYIETLQEEISNPRRRKYIDIIERNVRRLTNIVEDLLLLSKLEDRELHVEFEWLNLGYLVKNIVDVFKFKAKDKGLKLYFEEEPDLPIIKGDPFKLEQLFINLIDNAIKYTEKGYVRVSLGKGNGNVRIFVEDTGIGIHEKDIVRIFERFYVVDKSRSRQLGGTGLGLSIVKHIVLLHGGKIDVESILGKGTKFIIHLPLCPESE